jgi:hypothetical protein
MSTFVTASPQKQAGIVETLEELVSEGWKLDARIKEESNRLREIKSILSKAGAGRYAGAIGGEALVIFPGPRIETPADDQKLAELRSEILGDDDFKTLFERIVFWRPVKSCRDVAVRILTPQRLKKFLGICEVECPAQVRFS